MDVPTVVSQTNLLPSLKGHCRLVSGAIRSAVGMTFLLILVLSMPMAGLAIAQTGAQTGDAADVTSDATRGDGARGDGARGDGASGLPVGPNAASSNVIGPEADAPSSPGILSIVFSGGPAGVAVMMVLLALSLTALYLVIDQILTLRRSELLPAGLGEEVRKALKENRLEEATALCQESPSMLSFVLMHGIEELPFGWSSVEKSVEEALAEQSAQLYRRAEYLSVIGNIAPMVGLLGTVMGMIMAFHRVAESQGTASASELAEGIYQALITTVGGLIIAIPALGAFAIFRNRLDQMIAEAAYVAQHVFSPLRKKKSSSRSS